ncbi:MAG: 3'-5' exonuclease [Melioribacteraceae bacterium]|nr:3'-5' exonuclease [Melioribacteraceae bacterium]
MTFFKKSKKIEHYPDFWQNYLSFFSTKMKINIPLSQCKYSVIDVESSGLNPAKDRILSIGAIKIFNNEIIVSRAFEKYIDQSATNVGKVEIHGILKNQKEKKISEERAVKMFLDFIEDSILVGHSISFDISILNSTLKRLGGGKLKNKFLDTYSIYKRLKGPGQSSDKPISLDDLSKEFNIPASDRHTAPGDAMITSILFLKLLSRIKKRGINNIDELLRKRNILF